MNRKLNRRGFTLIELLLAMTLFVSVLIIATTGFIALNRTFSRGLVRKQLSDASQRVSGDLTIVVRSLPANSTPVDCTPGSYEYSQGLCSTSFQAFCVGNVRYRWPNDADPTGGLYKELVSSCSAAVTADAKQLVDGKFRVAQLKMENIGGGLYRVYGVLRTLDNTAVNLTSNPMDITCKGTAESVSVQSCVVEKFDTIIYPRGGPSS